LWLLLGASALLGAALWLGRAPDPLPVEHEAPVSLEQAAPPRASEPTPPVEPPILHEQAAEAAPPHRVRSPRSDARHNPATATSAPPRRSTAPHLREDELSLLQRSHKALRRDPAQALAIAEQHARDYPNGVFVQEREVLVLQALLKQRRRAEAIARARRFIAEQGDSPYAVRIRELLARTLNAPSTPSAPSKPASGSAPAAQRTAKP
jgi:hypothetical protein